MAHRSDMKYIELTKGYVAIVSDEDYENLSQFKWYASKSINSSRNTHYACRKRRKDEMPEGTWKKNLHVAMHREIMKPPPNKDIDHIDGNGLNNQRSNLRIVNKTQNMQNARRRLTNKSGCRGVSYDRTTSNKNKKWRAWIQVNGRFIGLGRYAEIEDAIKARKQAEKKYFGEYSNGS